MTQDIDAISLIAVLKSTESKLKALKNKLNGLTRQLVAVSNYTFLQNFRPFDKSAFTFCECLD